MNVETRTYRKWLRRIAFALAVAAFMAPTAQAIGAGPAVQYVPVCGPMFYGGAPDSLAVQPVCGPMFYGGAPDSVEANDRGATIPVGDRSVPAFDPLPVPSTESGIDWRDAGAGVGIGAALGLLAAGAVLALKRRRGRPVGA